MAARTIETKAIISAEDRTGNAFAAVVQKMAKMESAARHAGTGIASVDRAAATMRRAELAHDRERVKIQREMSHHGAARYATQAAASTLAAHSIVETITESLKGGAELQHSLTALKNSGRTMEEIAAIMDRAGEVMRNVPTSSLKENLDTILETTGAFGNLHHAMENLEFVQKITSVLKAAGDGEASSKSVAYDFAKFAEIRGSAGDTKRLQAEANEMTRGMVFTGGKFNPHEAFAFAQQTSSLLGKYSIHFLSRILPSLATESGGERTGTRANAFANVIMGKARDAKQTGEWMRLGLLDPSQVIKNKAGPQGWKAGAVKDTNLALSDPDIFAEKVLIPAMKKGGINTEDSFAVTKELNQLFRNGESNRFATAIVDSLQRARLHNDDTGIGKGGTVNEIFDRNLAQDPTVAMGALTSSLNSLMSVVSQPAMTAAASGISGLATGIQTLAASLKDHPLLALAGGTTLAGGMLAGAGTLAYSAANGFGLVGSATALDHSAVLLDGAAARLTAAGSVGTVSSAERAADKILAGGAGAAEATTGGVVKSGAKAAGLFGLSTIGSAGLLGGALLAFDGAMIYAVPKVFGHAKGARYGGKPMGWDEDADHPGMHFVAAPRRGSNGYWAPNAPAPAPLPTLAPIASAPSRLPTLIGPGGAPVRDKVSVDFSQPPPLRVIVEAGSSLLSIANDAKAASVQLKAQVRADTGPGGLGETSMGQH